MKNSLRLISGDFTYTEGPAWDVLNHAFIFSDILADTIYLYDLEGDAIVERLHPSGYANGNTFDRNGNLWSARHDRAIARTAPHGRPEIMIRQYSGKRLNSPNDLVVSDDGTLWFTDPPFGIKGFGPERADEEQPVRGVYRTKGTQAHLMTGKLTLPNGIAFSQDQEHLFVSDSSNGRIYRFAVSENGTLEDQTSFARIRPTAGQRPLVDGIKVDSEGNVWATGPGGIFIFNDEGRHLCSLKLPARHVSNLAFGGRDARDVFITAGGRVFLLKSLIPGTAPAQAP